MEKGDFYCHGFVLVKDLAVMKWTEVNLAAHTQGYRGKTSLHMENGWVTG